MPSSRANSRSRGMIALIAGRVVLANAVCGWTSLTRGAYRPRAYRWPTALPPEDNTFAAWIGAAAPAAGHALDAVQAAFHLHEADVVPSVDQRVGERLIARAALDLRRPVAAAEIGQLDRLLDVELPVEHAE